MDALPAHWTSLVVAVFPPDFKHRFDAGHLVTIDGLTRVSRCARLPFAPFCSVLFPLGHGPVAARLPTSRPNSAAKPTE